MCTLVLGNGLRWLPPNRWNKRSWPVAKFNRLKSCGMWWNWHKILKKDNSIWLGIGKSSALNQTFTIEIKYRTALQLKGQEENRFSLKYTKMVTLPTKTYPVRIEPRTSSARVIYSDALPTVPSWHSDQFESWRAFLNHDLLIVELIQVEKVVHETNLLPDTCLFRINIRIDHKGPGLYSHWRHFLINLF